MLLHDVQLGRPVRRRDAVRLARSILESAEVRAAEAVLDADDRHLLARLVDLLETTGAPSVARPRTTRSQ